jgi:predicted MFS family arabinose efflux permease
MILARAIQGIGAATLAPATLALLSTSFAEGPQRLRATAAYGALAGIATSIGMIIGGVLTQTLSWRVGFLLNVPIALAAIVAAPRYLPETPRHAGRVDLAGGLSSTLGVSTLVFGIVHSADAGWTDPVTLLALAGGPVLLWAFITTQRRSPQPLMPLLLLTSCERAGAYLARFLFNGALLSFYFFMSSYLEGVTGDTPLQAGLAFLPATVAAFAAATATSRLIRRTSNALMSTAGCAAMLIGTAWISRVSADTSYLTGIALPMIIFGLGQGLGLSTLTTGGMAGVAREDAGVAGGLVNVAHHTGGALGLGILVTILATAGASAHTPRAVLADRVSAALTGAAIFTAIALIVTLITHPRTARTSPARADVEPRPASAQTRLHRGAGALAEARAAASSANTGEEHATHQELPRHQHRTRRLVHRHGLHRHHRRSRSHRPHRCGTRALHPRRRHRLAHPPLRPDHLRHRRDRPLPTRRRTHRRDPPRRPRLLRTRREPLARRRRKPLHDPHRDPSSPRERQPGHMGTARHRRAVQPRTHVRASPSYRARHEAAAHCPGPRKLRGGRRVVERQVPLLIDLASHRQPNRPPA